MCLFWKRAAGSSRDLRAAFLFIQQMLGTNHHGYMEVDGKKKMERKGWIENVSRVVLIGTDISESLGVGDIKARGNITTNQDKTR